MLFLICENICAHCLGFAEDQELVKEGCFYS